MKAREVIVSYTEGPVTATDSFEITVVKRISITNVDIGNNQVTLEFAIRSANGRGYSVYLGNVTDGKDVALYGDWNSIARGTHFKKLVKGKTYLIFITYTENGERINLLA